MNLESSSDHSQQITITLDVISEDTHDIGSALVDAVRRDAIDELRNGGYTVQLTNIGRRGDAQLLFQVIAFLQNVAGDVVAQKDALDAWSALVTIFGAAIPVVKHIQTMYRKRTGKDETQNQPIKITIEVDGVSVPVEVPNLEGAEEVLKLAQRFQTNHPLVAAKVTPQSKVKIKASVPKKQTRRRR